MRNVLIKNIDMYEKWSRQKDQFKIIHLAKYLSSPSFEKLPNNPSLGRKIVNLVAQYTHTLFFYRKEYEEDLAEWKKREEKIKKN